MLGGEIIICGLRLIRQPYLGRVGSRQAINIKLPKVLFRRAGKAVNARIWPI